MIASAGALGTAQSSASGTTVAITTTQTVNVGDLIAVFAAWDNTDTGDTGTTAINTRLRCTDSAGNRYVTADSYVNGQGGAAAGAHAALFFCVATAQLASGGTITVTSDTARVSKAISAHRFTIETNFVAIESLRWRALNDATDPASISQTAPVCPPDTQHLMLHCLAGEGPQTDAYTWDAAYTQVAGAGTNTGTATSDMHVRGGYRIGTVTATETINVQSDTADRDYVQVAVMLREHTLTTFPITPILDTFTRANESPLSGGGTWDIQCNAGTATLDLSSNQVKSSVTTTTRRRYSQLFNRDVEAYISIPTKPSVATDQVDIISDVSSDTADNWDGNITQWLSDGSMVTALEMTNDTQISQFFVVGNPPAMVNGDKFGIRRRGDFCEAWVQTGGVWTIMAVYSVKLYNKGRVGIGVRGTTARLDDFGGGELALPVISYYDRLR